MKELDILFILNTINSGISLIMGFYMFFLQRNSFKLGTGYWATGSTIIGIGLLFKAFIPIENQIAVVGSSIFITIGLYLYLAGIWKFKEQKIHTSIILGIPILDIVQSIIFHTLFNSPRIHISLHLGFLIIYCLLAITAMLQLNSAQKYLKKIFFLNAIVFTIFLVLLLVKLYSVITKPSIDPVQITNAVVFMYVINGFVMIALTFGFLSAVNIRLNKNLQGQIKSNTKFLSIISHDLRGPVGNIMSFLNLLQNESDLNEKTKKEYIKILNTLSQSTFHLLQNLLDWATKSKDLNKFKQERIELSQVISSNFDLFRSSTTLKSIHLEFIEGDQTNISGNSNMLQTIVRNLVSNAIKFTPQGGTITIKTEKKINKVQLTVSDTGQGIKQKKIDSLFNFDTNISTTGTNGEVGSGLGLVLCKELVSINNGKIKIESTEGVGTCVFVEFPFADKINTFRREIQENKL